jgi:hypothetical protein
MKKMIFLVFGLIGLSLSAQAQLENYSIQMPPQSGPVLVGGGAPVYTPVAYDQPVAYLQPVVYNAPVQYFAPVQYLAPVYYNAAPAPDPAVFCGPMPSCSYGCSYSSVQVIRFGGGQARQQGYSFGSGR